MSQPVVQELIATKLAPPPVRIGYIARQRLMDALTLGRELRVTLVDAPTGYGKTTLVAGWCAELAQRGDRAIAWLSLTATENDPALLTRYLIGALRGAGASIGEGAETMLQVPGASPIAWMHSLVNDLASSSTEVTLVLDDYHVVTAPACHALLQFLIDHGPESLRMIICTRADPPLALGSLRAAAQLAEALESVSRVARREQNVVPLSAALRSDAAQRAVTSAPRSGPAPAPAREPLVPRTRAHIRGHRARDSR